MEVILLQKVANLGNIGDKVKVKPGYGRNYLLPQGKAAGGHCDQPEEIRGASRELEKLAADEMASAKLRAGQLENFRLSMAAKAGGEGKLFGSIGTADIAEALPRPAFASSAAKCACTPARSGWSASIT